MAKCKLCKAEIPDGNEYCNNCQDKGKLKSNESYLDSLLNSVKNNVPVAETIYKKKSNSSGNSPEAFRDNSREQENHEDHEDAFYQLDPEDIEDFDQFYKDEDIKNLSENITIPEEDLFGEKLSDLFEDIDLDNGLTKDIPQSADYAPTDLDLNNTSLYTNTEEAGIESGTTGSILDTPTVNTETPTANKETDTVSLTDDNLDEKADANKEENEDEDFDSDINDLLNSLDLLNNNDAETETAAFNNQALAEQEKKEARTDEKAAVKPEEEFEQIEAEEDDFLSLLNQISSDDPVADDVKAINDLLNGKPVSEKDKSGTPSDVGEVFSDALKVVSSLHDPSEEELAVLDQIPDIKGKKGKKDKKADKEEKAGKNKKKKGSGKKNKGELTSEAEQAKPKKGFFKRLFGNVEDEASNTKQQSQKSKNINGAASNETTSKGTGKKKPKGKKGASSPVQEDEEVLTGARGKGKPSEEQVPDNKDSKKGKKEKKEKKKKTKEIIQVIDEIEEDEGRINRLGAGIVFVFFGLLALLLLVGTNVISYTLSIQHATNYFDNQKYNQAYKEVYGEEIQAEDIELYEKIITVMFVNKQLNSYNNYYSLGKYPEALDSLLKGLKRYDKYIELATMLGIDSDLDYVRTQILAELKNVFNLSEAEALEVNSNSDMKEYSLEVYHIVREKMND